MTNRYYNESFTANVGTAAQGRAVEAQFQAIEAAFDMLQTETDDPAGENGILSLSGVPASYAGAAYRQWRVNGAESATEFVAPGSLPIKTITATSYTLDSADAGYLLVFTAGSAVTVTVPPNTAEVFGQGDPVLMFQKGTGQVTLVAGSGVSIRSTDGLLATRTQYAVIGLAYLGDDEWLANGERNAAALSFASLSAANVFTKAQTVAPVALADAASIATDASLSNTFTVTLGGNRTLANPTNLQDGVILNWFIKQDGTGSRTLAYGSNFKWPGGVAPALTTTANAVDLITGQYIAALGVISAVCIKDFR